MTTAEFDIHVARMRAIRTRLGPTHEAAAVAEARRFGATLASHDDTTAGQVAVSAAHGAELAEFPTTVEAARARRDHGIKVMMGAPNLIRGAATPATSPRRSWQRPKCSTSCRPTMWPRRCCRRP